MSTVTKYISIKQIINNLLRDEPYINNNELNLGDAVEWAGECLNSLGINSVYREFICTVPITNFRGALPHNYRKVRTVRESDTTIVLQETVREFLTAETENNHFTNEFEFKIVEDTIFVEFETGNVEILFQGYNLDSDGFPKILDEERLIKCVYFYIANKIARKNWMMGKLPAGVYQHIEQEHLFYMASARNKHKIPDRNKMQSIIDQEMQIVPDMNLFRNNMASLTNLDNIVLKR